MSSLTPNRDVVTFYNEPPSADEIAQILFEEIGGIELITIARRDTIDGLNPYYSVISNLANIRKQFDATEMITKQKNKQSEGDIYAIDLLSKIPSQEYLDENGLDNWFYLDDDGNLVIHLDNMEENEFVEVQVSQIGA